MENKNIDVNLYNEKTLNLLNIRELRDIGRKLRVPSPTTMKKKDLVDYILKVVYGEIKPPLRSACGRPNARDFDMNRYIDKIKKNSDQIEHLQEIRLSDDFDVENLMFKLASPKNSTYIGDIEQRVVFIDDSGCYLRVRQFVASENDIKLENELVEKLKLDNFDVIEVIKTSIGLKIISINGKKITNNIERFEDENYIIEAGTSKVFYLRTKEEIEKRILSIKNNCKVQGLQLVSFGLENLKEPFAKSFVLDNKDNANGKYKQFIIFIEYCKKLVYENKDFVILIQDMKLVEEILESLHEDVVERIKAHLNEEFDDFVKLGNILLGIQLVESVNY